MSCSAPYSAFDYLGRRTILSILSLQHSDVYWILVVSQPAILFSGCRGLNLIEIAYNDTQLPGSPFRFVSYAGRVCSRCCLAMFVYTLLAMAAVLRMDLSDPMFVEYTLTVERFWWTRTILFQALSNHDGSI